MQLDQKLLGVLQHFQLHALGNPYNFTSGHGICQPDLYYHRLIYFEIHKNLEAILRQMEYACNVL